jgi:hypothetical protein
MTTTQCRNSSPKHTPRHRPCNNPRNRLPNPRNTNNLPRYRRRHPPHTRHCRRSHDRNSRRQHGPRNRIRRRAQLDLRNPSRRLRYRRRDYALRLRRHIRDCSSDEYSSRCLCLRLRRHRQDGRCYCGVACAWGLGLRDCLDRCGYSTRGRACLILGLRGGCSCDARCDSRCRHVCIRGDRAADVVVVVWLGGIGCEVTVPNNNIISIASSLVDSKLDLQATVEELAVLRCRIGIVRPPESLAFWRIFLAP